MLKSELREAASRFMRSNLGNGKTFAEIAGDFTAKQIEIERATILTSIRERVGKMELYPNPEPGNREVGAYELAKLEVLEFLTDIGKEQNDG